MACGLLLKSARVDRLKSNALNNRTCVQIPSGQANFELRTLKSLSEIRLFLDYGRLSIFKRDSVVSTGYYPVNSMHLKPVSSVWQFCWTNFVHWTMFRLWKLYNVQCTLCNKTAKPLFNKSTGHVAEAVAALAKELQTLNRENGLQASC